MATLYIPAELRRLIYARARGRCEYCLMPDLASFAAHEIDHIIAQKHGGLTVADNLALACAFCNRRKSSDLAAIDPITGEIVRLFHPRLHHWDEHFRWDNAQITAMTPIGRATINLLQLNLSTRLQEREYLMRSNSF
jgi:HNH endonuclease